jgi:hypothetical protein
MGCARIRGLRRSSNALAFQDRRRQASPAGTQTVARLRQPNTFGNASHPQVPKVPMYIAVGRTPVIRRVDRGQAAIAIKPNAASRSGFASDRHSACTQRREITQQKVAATCFTGSRRERTALLARTGRASSGAVVPLTLIVILPTNNQLLDPTLDARSHKATLLLIRWGRLQAIRSILSTAAFALSFGGSQCHRRARCRDVLGRSAPAAQGKLRRRARAATARRDRYSSIDCRHVVGATAGRRSHSCSRRLDGCEQTRET